MKQQIQISHLGVSIQITSFQEVLLDWVKQDFGSLVAEDPTEPDFRITLVDSADVPWNTPFKAKSGRALHYLSSGNQKRVTFFDQVHVDYRFEAGLCFIYSIRLDLAYEVLQYVVQSYWGERWDSKGIHRVHGLSFASEGKGHLVLGKSGSGKTTLGIHLTEIDWDQPFQLLSDDVALIDRNGKLHVHPVRLSLKSKPRAAPYRSFDRPEFGMRFLIPFPKVEGPISVQLESVFLFQDSKIFFVCKNRIQLALGLIRWLVIGFEVPQIWELYIRFEMKQSLKLIQVLYSRTRLAIHIFRRCKFQWVNRANAISRIRPDLKLGDVCLN